MEDEPATAPTWLKRAMVYAALTVVAISFASWAFGKVQDLLLIGLISLFVAFALEPTVDRLERRGWRRGAATGAVFAAVVLALVGFVALVAVLVAGEVSRVSESFPQMIDEAERWLAEHSIEVDVDQVLEQLRANVAQNAVEASSTAVGVAARLATIAFFSFYLIVDGPRLRRAMCSLLPPGRQQQLLTIWEVGIDKTGSYLLSRAVLALISSAVHAVVFVALDVPYGVVLGIWVGVLSQFLPVIGTYIGGALPVLAALRVSPTQAVVVLVVLVVYQQLENYLILPKIQGRAMEMHPAVALGSVIVGGTLLGLTGAVLALPAAACIQAFASAYLQRYRPVDHELLGPDAPVEGSTGGPVDGRTEPGWSDPDSVSDAAPADPDSDPEEPK